MKRPAAGLICAGGVSQSFFARLPSVLAAVGPVLSSSLRVARRMANSLRTGHAIDDASAFAGCEVVWVVVPDARLDWVAREFHGYLQHAGFIVVCDSTRSSVALGLGPRVATLDVVDPAERIFAAEGHRDALRMLRRTLTEERRKLIEISSKPLLRAGVSLTSQLMLTSFSAGVESLRAAGFARKDATAVAETLGTLALRAYNKAGKKAWDHTTVPDSRRSLEEDLDAIRAADPKIAETYASAIEQALRYF